MKTEMNNAKLGNVNGGSILGKLTDILMKKCDKCGKKYGILENHICVTLPKLDVDNRPAINPALHGPAVREK